MSGRITFIDLTCLVSKPFKTKQRDVALQVKYPIARLYFGGGGSGYVVGGSDR